MVIVPRPLEEVFMNILYSPLVAALLFSFKKSVIVLRAFYIVLPAYVLFKVLKMCTAHRTLTFQVLLLNFI